MNEETLNLFLEKGFLVSPDLFSEEVDSSIVRSRLNIKDGPVVINKEFFGVLSNGGIKANLNWQEFERSIALREKGQNAKTYETFLELLSYNKDLEVKKKVDSIVSEIRKDPLEVKKDDAKPIHDVREVPGGEPGLVVVKNFKEEVKKREVKDFVMHFRDRYESLKNMLMNRLELQNLTSINRIQNREGNDAVSVIGIVFEKRYTKNGNIQIDVEDVTGIVKVIANKDRRDVFEAAKDVTLDEVIGVSGTARNNFMFATKIIFPDVLMNTNPRKCPEEIYAAFISDVHVGSRKFMEKEFLTFIKWLNCEHGTEEERERAKKVKYLFIVGDLIDGVGVYPGQEKELVILDIMKQYERAAEILSLVRKDLKIIICPGQHDALRVAEPQPALNKEYGPSFFELQNVVLVSNPALINIAAAKDFEGIDVLMYHGASFHYFIDNIDSLRLGMARDNPRLLMKFLLQKRHLAPSHASSGYVPTQKDYLVIDKVPDIFACGDMHRSDVSTYNGVITINGSCWQTKTDFQEKTGNNPDFCRVPIINLKTREVTMMRFDPNENK